MTTDKSSLHDKRYSESRVRSVRYYYDSAGYFFSKIELAPDNEFEQGIVVTVESDSREELGSSFIVNEELDTIDEDQANSIAKNLFRFFPFPDNVTSYGRKMIFKKNTEPFVYQKSRFTKEKDLILGKNSFCYSGRFFSEDNHKYDDFGLWISNMIFSSKYIDEYLISSRDLYVNCVFNGITINMRNPDVEFRNCRFNECRIYKATRSHNENFFSCSFNDCRASIFSEIIKSDLSASDFSGSNLVINGSVISNCRFVTSDLRIDKSYAKNNDISNSTLSIVESAGNKTRLDEKAFFGNKISLNIKIYYSHGENEIQKKIDKTVYSIVDKIEPIVPHLPEGSRAKFVPMTFQDRKGFMEYDDFDIKLYRIESPESPKGRTKIRSKKEKAVEGEKETGRSIRRTQAILLK